MRNETERARTRHFILITRRSLAFNLRQGGASGVIRAKEVRKDANRGAGGWYRGKSKYCV